MMINIINKDGRLDIDSALLVKDIKLAVGDSTHKSLCTFNKILISANEPAIKILCSI